MLSLHHTVHSVSSQKVRVQLKEKALDWTSHPMTLRGDQNFFAAWRLNLNARRGAAPI
jgi:hypothetical protein